MRFPYPRRRHLSQRPENVQRRMNRRLFNALAAIVIAGGYALWNHFSAPGPAAPATPANTTIASAGNAAATNAAGDDIDALIGAQRGNVEVTVQATVARVLKEDSDGSRHQRFSIETPGGHRVLVAHNVDLAPAVDGLRKGEPITLHGEFEWNAKGGVLHWTHRDPAGRHENGWIEYQGRRYQ